MSETKGKILIVDDEKPLANILASELQRDGFETRTASNGKEALDLIEKEKFDLILLDLLMPVMDGFHVLNELAEKKNQIPVFVTTNLGQEEDKKKASGYGIKDYLVKTDVSITDLVGKVNTFIAKNKH